MIDGIVEEHHLCRFHYQSNQRKQMVVDKYHCQLTERLCEPYHNVSHEHISEDSQKHTDDSDREIIDQHLESILHLSFDLLIELLDAPSSEGTHHHCTDEHRNTTADDNTHSRNCSSHTTSVACNILSCSVTDEDREKIFEHRVHKFA